ncbi:MAG: HAD hydrolase-like protein, partial [Desulfurococcales archaeon]|nr:HAD hydrolase-like protein [Desulfurococcales archaeon]
ASSALKALLNGAKLVAANRDEVLPTPQGPSLGAGGIVSLLETSSGVKAVVTVGKPSRFLSEYLLSKAEGNAAFVGDKISTDMMQARLMGLPGILVGGRVRENQGNLAGSDVHRVENLLELI